MSANNPAGRLLTLLEEGKRKPKDKPSYQIWAELLECESEDFTDTLRRLGLVQQLPFRARQQIISIPHIDIDLYLKWIPKVELAFRRVRLSSNWQDFIGHIDDATLLALQFCDDRLSRSVDIELTHKDLEDIRIDVDDVNKAIADDDLDAETYTFLADHLRRIERSVIEYGITGHEGIREASELSLASIATNRDKYIKSIKTRAGKKFWSLIEKLVLLTTLTVNTLFIGQYLNKQHDVTEAELPPENAEVIEIPNRAVIRDADIEE